MKDQITLRIQKYLADQGISSRREAERMVRESRVEINGVLATVGHPVNPAKDSVTIDGKRIQTKTLQKVTLLLNKPKGLICSNSDPHYQNTIFDLLPPPLQKERLFCAGRLDKDSEGMVILTNDGELAHRLTHPTWELFKRYRITLNRDLQPQDIGKFLQGVTHDGEFLKAEKIIPLKIGQDRQRKLEVHLNHGKKREIRRLFEAGGYFVKKLKRFQIGSLEMKNIPLGGFRILNKKECQRLSQTTSN